MMEVVYPLLAAARPRIIEHLKALPAEDRRLRFGAPTSDAMIEQYVEKIDFSRDAVLAIRGENGALIALTHVAHGDDHAELGLSVLPEHRGQGHAQAMFERAALYARNRGIRELYMHCLSENAAMMHIARKASMRIVIDGFERDAWLELPPATALSLGEEFQQGQLVLLDWTLRTAVERIRAASRSAAEVFELTAG